MGLAELVEKDSQLCVKCGACRSICPVMEVVGREQGVARGKIALARDLFKGDSRPGVKLRESISQCLLCMSCTEICANSVRTDRIMLAAREYINGGSGFLPFVLRNLGFFSWFIRSTQRILMRRERGESTQRFRLAPYPYRDLLLPVFKGKPFLSGVQEVLEGSGKGCFAFFVGCMFNVAYQEMADRTLSLLRKAGEKILIPLKQMCCGLPLFAEGDIENARRFALQNLELFEKHSPDRIVVACASCGSMLKEYYPFIFKGRPEEGRVKKFANRVVDLSEILVELNLPEIDRKKRVTFHDPCHLKRGMGVFSEPRELLKRSGHELLEMKESDRCCGFSGSFSVKFPEISDVILERKIKNAVLTGAEILVTSCPGCIMQLKKGVVKYGAAIEVRHLVEVLQE